MRRGSFWRGLITGGIVGAVASHAIRGKRRLTTARLLRATRGIRGRARQMVTRGLIAMLRMKNRIR